MGDWNTIFYHTKALIHHLKNHISELKNENGVGLPDKQQLVDLAWNYFAKLYTLEDSGFTPFPIIRAFPKVPKESLIIMDKMVTFEEVKQALFEIKPLKASGIDGLHALFF